MINPRLSSEMPKLVLATPYFYPKVGGLENYAFEMAASAAKSGYDVVIITSGDKKQIEITEEYGFRLYRLPVQATISNTPISMKWYWDIKRILKIEKPQLINVHAPVPFMADMAALAAGRKIPVIVTYHSGPMHKGLHLSDAMIYCYERCMLPIMLHRAKRIICSSDFVRDTFLKSYVKKSVTITPGVNTSEFSYRKRLSTGNRVLFIGNFASKTKGFDYLKKAVMKMPNVHLDVVGSGSQTPHKRTTYFGVLRGQQLVQRIHAARMVVLPSTGPSESFGMVLVEAMACGVPVIGSNVGGIPSLIKNRETGLLVPPTDEQALSNAISELLNDKKLERQLVDNAYQMVRQKYNWDIQTRKFIQLLEDEDRSLNRHKLAEVRA